MITEERIENALHFLVNTDRRVAEQKTEVARSEYLMKRAESMAFKLSEGTVADRNAEAKTTSLVQDASTRWLTAMEAYEVTRAQRETAQLLIEVWRSEEASRRRA